MTVKDSKYVKINNVNPLYLVIKKVNGYFEEINGNKYSTLVSTNESKVKKKKKYEELWSKIRDFNRDYIYPLESPSLGRSNTSERSMSGNGGTGVPLVVNYNPILCRLGQVICKNLCFLYQDEEVKQVFNLAPFFHFVVLELLGVT